MQEESTFSYGLNNNNFYKRGGGAGGGGRGGGHQLAAPRARRMSRPAPTLEGGALPIMAYTGKLGRIEYLFHASGI